MRIDNELEEILKKLEESSIDNNLSLLDVASALEKTYDCVNRSFLKDEKGFSKEGEYYHCEKKGYDPIKGKMIYSVKKRGTSEELVNIGISNLGEMSFEVVGSNKNGVEELIQKMNAPINSEFMEEMRMNADISFFTENRELMLSKKPYVAIKMGNFVEGDKAVLVYKEEKDNRAINKSDDVFKYIRIDQIKDYLKDIKVDERTIPTLMYAFIGKNNETGIKICEREFEKSTYPYLTDEKIRKFTSPSYEFNLGFNAVTMGMIGMGICACFGVINADMIEKFIGEFFFGTLGVSTIMGSSYYFNGRKNIKRSGQKGKLLDEAFIDFYKVLKVYARENIEYMKKQFVQNKNKEKKNNFLEKKDSKALISENFSKVREMLSSVNQDKAIFCNIVLAQILNTYDNGKNDVSLELEHLVRVVKNLDNYNISDLVNYAIGTVKDLLCYVDTNSSIEVINNLDYAIVTKASSNIADEKKKWNREIRNCYFEAMLLSDALSIRKVAFIPKSTRLLLLEDIDEFAEQLKYDSNGNKKIFSSLLKEDLELEEPSEVKIVKAINTINNRYLGYDFLGKEISKGKVLKK